MTPTEHGHPYAASAENTDADQTSTTPDMASEDKSPPDGPPKIGYAAWPLGIALLSIFGLLLGAAFQSNPDLAVAALVLVPPLTMASSRASYGYLKLIGWPGILLLAAVGLCPQLLTWMATMDSVSATNSYLVALGFLLTLPVALLALTYPVARKSASSILMSLLLSCLYSVGTLAVINSRMDFAPATSYDVWVTSLSQCTTTGSHGKAAAGSGSCYIELGKPIGRVSYHGESWTPGDVVHVTVHRGGLGVPWTEMAGKSRPN